MKFRLFFITIAMLVWPAKFVQAQTEINAQWPQFHGYMGRGILDHTDLPENWNLATGENILWKTPIPGLAHSSPVIWGNRVFVSSAIGQSSSDSLKIGLYGDTDMAGDQEVHQFKLYCIDRTTGKILWERLAYSGVPKERRHTKSTYANPTPATDGTCVVVSFGSNGLFCYDFDGNLLWEKDLGSLATGPFNEPGVEWGYSSSPVIHQGKVIIQCDLLKNSFATLLDIKTGKEVWKISRDAISSWGSPAVCETGDRTLIILNAYPYISALDFRSGNEVWKIGEVGDAPAPTAVTAHGLIYINSAHGKYSPILAIRPEATGDITLKPDSTNSRFVAWSFKRGGAYMASPLVYGNYLYNMQINGTLTCIDALTGAVRYKKDLGKAFSGSGVASDNRLYFPAETGEVFVLEAGPEYKLIAENQLGEVCMSTPALSHGMILFRAQHHLIAIGRKPGN